MALSTKHRTSLYQSLAPLVGAEEADALLNELPPIDLDEIVTKTYLRAELATAMHAQTNRLVAAMLGSMTALTAIFSVVVLLAR